MKKVLYTIVALAGAWLLISGTCSSESTPVAESQNEEVSIDEVNDDAEADIQGDNKVFLVKSGKRVSNLRGIQNGKETTIWDNYGNDIHTISNLKIEMMGFSQEQNTVIIQTGGFTYNLDPKTKTGTKIKADLFAGQTGKEKREFGMEYIKQLNGKLIGNETVAGKECEVWLINQQNMEMKIWLWKGMTLKSVVNMGQGMEQVTETISVDLSFSIPGDQFSLEGYTIRDMGDVQQYMNQY